MRNILYNPCKHEAKSKSGKLIVSEQVIELTEIQNEYYQHKQNGTECYMRQYGDTIILLYWNDDDQKYECEKVSTMMIRENKI